MLQVGVELCSLQFNYTISLHIVPIRAHEDMKESL